MKDPMGLILAAARTSPVLMEAARAVEARIADLEALLDHSYLRYEIQPLNPKEQT